MSLPVDPGRREVILAGLALACPVLLGAQNETKPGKGQRPALLLWEDENGRTRPVLTEQDWEQRRRVILKGMEQAMGPLPDRSKLPGLDVEVVATVPGDGYKRLSIRFTVERGDRLPAYLYLPDGAAGNRKTSAVLALHPTNAVGKGVVDGQSEGPNRAYGKELAQRGYIVIAPDYPSFGEYQPYDFEGDPYESGSMKGIFNHMRCVDLLQERPEVDPDHIGVIGHSLGGHNAMFVGAFDERLKVVVSNCGWTLFNDYYNGDIRGWTSDRYMPRLRDVYKLDPDRVPFDFEEVIAAMAPRGFFSSSPLHDDNFDVNGVKKGIARARKVYELLGVPGQLKVIYPNCAHDFPPEARREAYEFMDAALNHRPVKQVP